MNMIDTGALNQGFRMIKAYEELKNSLIDKIDIFAISFYVRP